MLSTGVPNQDGSLYEFGPFRLSPAQGSLMRNGNRVHLAPRTFEVLVFLIDRRSNTVSKQELLLGVWAGLHVDESNVERQISDLRKVFADQTGNDGYIRTFSKRGYQFVAPVMEILGQPIPDDGPGTTEDVQPHQIPVATPNEVLLDSRQNPSGALAKDSVGPFLSTMSCLIALIIALVLAQWGFAGTLAVLLFAASLIDYCRAPDGVGRRAWTAAMLILSGALLPSVVTYPELARETVNFNAIPPSALYPFVVGLKFVPLFIVTLGFWVFAIRFEGGPVGVVSAFRRLYFGVGSAVLLLTVAILLDASADWRIVAAGITQAWLMVGGWTIVLALNIFILITGWIGFSRANKTDSTYAFSRCVAAYIPLALVAAFAISHQYNQVNRSHLNIRRPARYVLRNPDAIERWRSVAVAKTVGEDLAQRLDDPSFRRLAGSTTFYRQNFDEPFQASQRAVMFGYFRASDAAETGWFEIIRFPQELVQEFQFEMISER